MTKDEAMKLALEALVGYELVYGSDEKDREAVRALRQAIEQAEKQEPVAWMWRCKPYCDWPNWSVSLKRPADSGRDGHERTEGYEDIPLYTTPQPQREWVGLTDEEIDKIYETKVWDARRSFARAIEAKLKEKNT